MLESCLLFCQDGVTHLVLLVGLSWQWIVLSIDFLSIFCLINALFVIDILVHRLFQWDIRFVIIARRIETLGIDTRLVRTLQSLPNVSSAQRRLEWSAFRYILYLWFECNCHFLLLLKHASASIDLWKFFIYFAFIFFFQVDKVGILSLLRYLKSSKIWWKHLISLFLNEITTIRSLYSILICWWYGVFVYLEL